MNAVDEDSQLLIDACRGSVEAFAAVVVLHEPRLRRMLYGMTHDVSLTQDLCQETSSEAVLLEGEIEVDLVHIVADLCTNGRVSVNVPLCPVSDRPNFEPQAVPLGHPMKVIGYLRLVAPTNVIQVVEEEESISSGKCRHSSK